MSQRQTRVLSLAMLHGLSLRRWGISSLEPSVLHVAPPSGTITIRLNEAADSAA
ncbi:MAG: hypothetical protein JW388_1155 [Nitrospira sp.]|nr:hypothetical protein [Nitrospira sp.]